MNIKDIPNLFSGKKCTIIIYYTGTCTESLHPQITGVPHDRGITVEQYDLSDSKSNLTVPWNRHWPGRGNINHR